MVKRGGNSKGKRVLKHCVLWTLFSRIKVGKVLISPPETQGTVDVAKARECYNAMALSCGSDEVLQQFKRCLGLAHEPIKADMIVDLRNAVRRELEFGQEIDRDRANAWIARLNSP